MVGSQEISGGFAVQWSIPPKRFVVKKGSNVLNSSREGEQLFYYHCFDCLESKAFLANVLRGFMRTCRCDEGRDHSVLLVVDGEYLWLAGSQDCQPFPLQQEFKKLCLFPTYLFFHNEWDFLH